jgi:tripartite-type tricarboxylate transporter receptor subunit TctC
MRHWISIGAVVAVVALALIATWPSPASTQARVSSRPVQFICPAAAGGATDRIAQMLAGLLEKDLGQPVTVVNRTRAA